MVSDDFSIPSRIPPLVSQRFQQSFRIGAALLRNFQGAAYAGSDLKGGLDAELRRQLVTALQERFYQLQFFDTEPRDVVNQSWCLGAWSGRGQGPDRLHLCQGTLMHDNRAGHQVTQAFVLLVEHRRQNSHAIESKRKNEGEGIDHPQQVSSHGIIGSDGGAGIFDDTKVELALAEGLTLHQVLADGEVSPLNQQQTTTKQR